MVELNLTRWVYGDDIFRYISDQDYCAEDLTLSDFSGIYDEVLIYLYINDSEDAFIKFSKTLLADHERMILDEEANLKWGIIIPFEKYKDLVVTGDTIYYQISTVTTIAQPFAPNPKRSNSRKALAKVISYAQDIVITTRNLIA